jgi:hypothetical protein
VPQLAQEEFDVWAWKTVHCRETQRRVLSDNWAPDLDFIIRNKIRKKRETGRRLCIMEWSGMAGMMTMTDTDQFSGAPAFFSSYFLGRALYLWYYFF